MLSGGYDCFLGMRQLCGLVEQSQVRSPGRRSVRSSRTLYVARLLPAHAREQPARTKKSREVTMLRSLVLRARTPHRQTAKARFAPAIAWIRESIASHIAV
jgi:hypothetical protein